MEMKVPVGVRSMENDKYVALARNHPEWQQVKASFAIEGMALTEDNEVIAGRMIAGEITLQEALTEIRRQHGVQLRASDAPISESVN